MKETYKVGVPKHIMVGDPWYFERKSGEELARLIVDICPSQKFRARVELEEKLDEDSDYMSRTMRLTISSARELPTYMRGMYYMGQEEKGKPIPVDTAKYRIKVDEREMMIRTGGDGYWGGYYEYSHKVAGKEMIDAHIVEVYMPDDMDFERLRETMRTLFPDAKQVENLRELNTKYEQTME